MDQQVEVFLVLDAGNHRLGLTNFMVSGVFVLPWTLKSNKSPSQSMLSEKKKKEGKKRKKEKKEKKIR